MAFKKIEKADVVDSGGQYITESGNYDVVIKHLVYAESAATGSQAAAVNFWVDYDGKLQYIRGGINVYNTDGADNKIGQSMLNELAIIAGLEGIHELGDPSNEITIPIGENGAKVTVPVYDLVDIPVTMRMRREYYVWDGKIRNRKSIKKFYDRDTKATAAEIIKGDADAMGEQFLKAQNYPLEDSYDGCTKEEAEAEARTGKSGRNSGGAKKPKLFNVPNDKVSKVFGGKKVPNKSNG